MAVWSEALDWPAISGLSGREAETGDMDGDGTIDNGDRLCDMVEVGYGEGPCSISGE